MRGKVRNSGLLYRGQASYQFRMSSMALSSEGVIRKPPYQNVDSKRMEVAVSGGVRSGVELSVLSSYGHIIAIRKLLPFDQGLIQGLPFCVTNYVYLAMRLV